MRVLESDGHKGESWLFPLRQAVVCCLDSLDLSFLLHIVETMMTAQERRWEIHMRRCRSDTLLGFPAHGAYPATSAHVSSGEQSGFAGAVLPPYGGKRALPGVAGGGGGRPDVVTGWVEDVGEFCHLVAPSVTGAYSYLSGAARK